MSKKLIHLALVGMLIVFVGNVGALTVNWDDGEPADNLWSSPANWLGDILPGALDETYIDQIPGAILNTTAAGTKCNVGRAAPGRLLITGGANLTLSSDLNIGYATGGGGIVTVEGRNTLVTVGGGLKVGRQAPYGTIVMRGGTINVTTGNIDIPSSSSVAGVGHLQLSGGTVTGSDLRMRVVHSTGGAGVGTMDVGGGKMILNNDRTLTVQPYITSGWITAYGGYGTLQMDYNVSNSGKTTLTALSDLNPSPADYSLVSHLLPTTVPLSWTNLDPNHPGAPVTVDVWFGEDPNKTDPANTKLLTGSPLSTVNSPVIPVASLGGPYYWWVDTDNGAPEVIEAAFSFYVSDDLPPSVVIDTLPMATWIGRSVQLNTTVTDDGRTPVTFLWTSSDPNAVFSDPNAVEPTVTMDYRSGRFTVTVTASDGNPLGGKGTASVYIYCDSSPCEAGRNYAGLDAVYPTDILPDCKHNLEDLAELAKNWLIDYTLTAPTPYVP